MISGVLARKHVLQDVPLTVQPYYKWLGSSAASVLQTHIPHESQMIDFVTVICESRALDHIVNTPALKKEMEERLERDSYMISWPESDDHQLKVKFVKTSHQKYPPPDWADKCRSATERFLSEIKRETVNILQEIWNQFKMQVEERMKHQNFMVKHDFDDDQCDLYFAGKQDAFDEFRSMVESIKTSLEEELRKKQEQISETTTLSPHQLMILTLCDYAGEVAAAGKDVQVEVTLNEVHITGMTDEVKRAKLKLLEKISQLQQDMVSISEARAALMQIESAKSHLLECFRRQKIVASWTIRDNELSLFACSKDQLIKATEVINSALVEEDITLDAASKSLMLQQKWKDFEKQLIAEHQTAVVYKGKEGVLVLCCTEECSGAVLEKVTDFIERNSLVQKFVPLLRPVVDLLEQFMASDVNKIASKLQQCGGHLKRASDDSEPGFVLLGSRTAVELASNELTKLLENLAVYDHEIDRAGIPAYLMSTQGTAILSDLQRRHQAIIDLENCRESAAEESSPGGRNTSTGPVVKYSRKVS